MSEALVESRLTELESVIERGQQTFIEVGVALAEIRDSKLYRERFATFEDYCKDRWGWNASRSRQLIGAAEAVASMQSVTVVTQSELPSVQTERQARELAKIKDPEIRAEVWQRSNEIAAEIGTAVTAKLVKEAVQQTVAETNGNARQLHVEAIKNSPATRWSNFLYEIQLNINSIRDNGGITHLAGRWSLSQKQGYLERLKQLRESIDKIAEQLEGAIEYDGN